MASNESKVCAAYAKRGDLEGLKRVRLKGYEWDYKTCSNAALNGHLDVLKWARMNKCPWGESCANQARICLSVAESEDDLVEMAQWISDSGLYIVD